MYNHYNQLLAQIFKSNGTSPFTEMNHGRLLEWSLAQQLAPAPWTLSRLIPTERWSGYWCWWYMTAPHHHPLPPHQELWQTRVPRQNYPTPPIRKTLLFRHSVWPVFQVTVARSFPGHRQTWKWQKYMHMRCYNEGVIILQNLNDLVDFTF